VLLRRAFSTGAAGARGWAAANAFTAPTFRWLLAQDSEQKVTVTVTDAAGRVLWNVDGDTKAGYHELPWQGGRGGAQGGGQGGGGPGGQRGGGLRPGHFAVTIACGEEHTTMPFTIVDRRGPAAVLGGVPALGASEGEPDEEFHDLGEEAEEEAEHGEHRLEELRAAERRVTRG
jgi:hypothetical protein